MKKLVLLLAVAFSVSMFSCGNGNGKDAKDSVADTNAVPETTEVTEAQETTEATETVVENDSDKAVEAAPEAEQK